MSQHPKLSFFIFAGETSGDLHGGPLVKKIKEHFSAEIAGVGGSLMRQQGIECILPMEEFQVMGFTDVFLAMPRLIKNFKVVRTSILKKQPDVVILIDYPGFNLRLAHSLRKHGFKGKIVQMICPTVWAWGKGRIKKMERDLDLLLTIFPFEKQYFSQTSLPVSYIGHPLVNSIANYPRDLNWKKIYQIPEHAALLSLFPGSRSAEITNNFLYQLESAKLYLQDHPNTFFAISTASEDTEKLIKQLLPKEHLPIACVPKEFRYEMMRDSFAAIAKSGTVIFELALLQCPTVVTYEVSFLNRIIAQYLFRLDLPYYSIPNILLDQEVFPEVIGTGISPQEVYSNLIKISTTDRKKCLNLCNRIPEILQSLNPLDQTIEAIRKLIYV